MCNHFSRDVIKDIVLEYELNAGSIAFFGIGCAAILPGFHSMHPKQFLYLWKKNANAACKASESTLTIRTQQAKGIQ